MFLQSGDGGLYGERKFAFYGFEGFVSQRCFVVLQNRAFQQVTPGTSAALNAWHAVGNTTLNVVSDGTPVSASLPNSLQVTFPSGSGVGFSNEGFWGKSITLRKLL